MDAGKRGVSAVTSRGKGQEATHQEQTWENTYIEHIAHVRHRARVPVTDGLVERNGTLQYIEGRMAAWSDRVHSKGRDDDQIATSRQYANGGTRTSNIINMVVTELVSQSPMG